MATTAQAAADRTDATHRQTVYLAVNAAGDSNVYANGWTCLDCDDTYDPHHRTGVPCRAAQQHAARTVANWNTAVGGARLEVVEVPAGDRDQVTAAARAAISTAPERPHSHTPGDGYDTRAEWDELNRQNRLVCNVCGEVVGILCG
ncbi:hypothetical protein ACFYTC_48565 [Actinomadura nitritigenes]|jgi:hypothetical protein|uniref:hypothetical protein n=1 Tax=Actinomadura nitritigenes TaxID=134602 RepID=UPI00369BD522